MPDWTVSCLKSGTRYQWPGVSTVFYSRERAVVLQAAAAAASQAGHRAWNVPVFVNLLSFPGVRGGWNQALRVPRPIPNIGLCVAAVSQKKKFYFHLLIYWHGGLFLPRVFCAGDSLGEAPKCHVPGPTGTAGCRETKPSVFRGWSQSRSPWLLSEQALLTHRHKWAPGWGPQSGMRRKEKYKEKQMGNEHM